MFCDIIDIKKKTDYVLADTESVSAHGNCRPVAMVCLSTAIV